MIRFIILGTARTGSNFLMSLLSGHEKIKVYGELFNLDMLPEPQLRQVLDDPIGYLKKKMYEPLPGSKMAIGFKIFYDHLTNHYFEKMVDRSAVSDETTKLFDGLTSFVDRHYSLDDLYQKFNETWNFLAGDEELKVIHLKRKNKLETLVSLKTAYLSNEWMNYKGNQTDKTGLCLAYEECSSYFTAIETFEKNYDEKFRHHSRLEMIYEDLVENKEQELKRVFDFLNVPPMTVSTRLKKQINHPLSEIIVNYDQLKRDFRKSPWSIFFV